MKFLPAQLGRVDPELVGGRLDQPLDEERGLGDPERAAVGDPAGGLVGVGAVGDHVGRRDVVGAGDDVEQAGLELARLGVGVGVALVGQHVDPQAEHLAVVAQGQLALHVEVAGEPGGDQVAGAVLDPLDRPPDQQRGRGGDHIAGVDRDLVAEAAADVGRDDLDLVLGQAGDQREHRPVGVRGLGGHVDGGLAGDRVDVGHAAAGLHRGRVAAGVEGVEARPPGRPRRRPGRWPRRRPPPSGRCGCPACLPCRRGSPGRPAPGSAGG